jgi:hypothetical protein
MNLNRSRLAGSAANLASSGLASSGLAPSRPAPSPLIPARPAPSPSATVNPYSSVQGDARNVVWLPRSRKAGRRPGDLLVVLLASGVIILLGLVAVIVRFGPANEPAASLALAPQAQRARPSPPAAPAPPPAARETAKETAKETARETAKEAVLQTAMAPAPVAAARAIVPAAPLSEQPPGLAFAPDPPRLVTPVPEPAPAPRVARLDPQAAPTPTVRPAPVREPSQTGGAKPALAKPDAAKPEAAKPEAAKPDADKAESAPLRRGGEGSTWAVYFDRFPDQKSVAAQINALQGKYGPHLGGRRLTYARASDEGWRVRVAGLTAESAGEICEKVRKTGGACAVGGR